MEKLDHPNIIKFFRQSIYEEKLTIVMEYA